MRLPLLGAVLAAVVLPAFAAHAADLDYLYAPPPEPYIHHRPPPVVYEIPPSHYRRPVLEFDEGYDGDLRPLPPRFAYGPVPRGYGYRPLPPDYDGDRPYRHRGDFRD